MLERFSRPTDFGVRWRRLLETSPGVRVLLNAAATEILLSPDQGGVEHLAIKAPDGRRLAVHARRFVLAMGGLEIPRLLLASTAQRPDGVGNDHGWVGRNYMCHLAAIAGSVTFTGDPSAVAFGHRKDAHGVYYRRRLLLSAEAQREHRVLNLAFRLQTQDPSDPAHGDGVLSALHLYKRRHEEDHHQSIARPPGATATPPATSSTSPAIPCASPGWRRPWFVSACWRIARRQPSPSARQQPLRRRVPRGAGAQSAEPRDAEPGARPPGRPATEDRLAAPSPRHPDGDRGLPAAGRQPGARGRRALRRRPGPACRADRHRRGIRRPPHRRHADVVAPAGRGGRRRRQGAWPAQSLHRLGRDHADLGPGQPDPDHPGPGLQAGRPPHAERRA